MLQAPSSFFDHLKLATQMSTVVTAYAGTKSLPKMCGDASLKHSSSNRMSSSSLKAPLSQICCGCQKTGAELQISPCGCGFHAVSFNQWLSETSDPATHRRPGTFCAFMHFIRNLIPTKTTPVCSFLYAHFPIIETNNK